MLHNYRCTLTADLFFYCIYFSIVYILAGFLHWRAACNYLICDYIRCGREQSIVMSMSVCSFVSLSVCPRAYLWNCTFDLHKMFLWLLPMAMAQSFSGGVVIRYVLPILWMTSCFHIMARNRQHEKGMYSKWLNMGQHIFDTVVYT